MLFRSNRYNPSAAEIALEGRKVLKGGTLQGEDFTFELTGISGEDADGNPVEVPLPESVRTVNDAAGNIRFGSIRFTDPGEYVYEIREIHDGQPGVSYDGTVFRAAVTVTDEGGSLRAEVSVPDSGILFENSYTPQPAVLEGESALGGRKQLEGRELHEGEFLFRLLDETGQEVDTAVNRADGSFAFDPLTFDRAGVWQYFIEEAEGTLGGVAYDPSRYQVTVTVTDAGRYLAAAAEYTDGSGNPAEGAAFVNEYRPEEATVQLGAQKILQGRELKDGEFTFRLEGDDGGVGDTEKNRADGSVRFRTLAFREAGTYRYTISEETGEEPSIRYDPAAYTVTVTVTDDQAGHLTAQVAYDAPAVFRNFYEGKENDGAPSPAPDPGTPTGTGTGTESQKLPEGGGSHTEEVSTGDQNRGLPYAAAALCAGAALALLAACLKKRNRAGQ